MGDFNFYFAGEMNKRAESFKFKNNANILKSWFVDLRPLNNAIKEKKEGRYSGNIMVDSGAFTAHRKNVVPDCEKYIQFLNENEPYLTCYVQLDKIPGEWGKPRTREQILQAEEESWENYKYMLTKLKNPFKLLAVFHQDEKFENLQRLLDYKINGKPVEYICISGAKDRAAKERHAWYHKCFEIIKESSNPDVNVHCLGCSTVKDLLGFPFYSSDSSSWAQTAAFGGIQDKEVIGISDVQLKNSETKYNFELVKPFIEERCKRYDIDIDKLITQGYERGCYNMAYMLDWVKENDVGKHFTTVKTRKLF